MLPNPLYTGTNLYTGPTVSRLPLDLSLEPPGVPREVGGEKGRNTYPPWSVGPRGRSFSVPFHTTVFGTESTVFGTESTVFGTESTVFNTESCIW